MMRLGATGRAVLAVAAIAGVWATAGPAIADVAYESFGPRDETEPVLVDPVLAARSYVLPASGSVPLRVDLRARDSGGGVRKVLVQLEGVTPGTITYPDELYGYGVRTSGSIHDGRWVAEVQLTADVPPGTYAVSLVVPDFADNWGTAELGDVVVRAAGAAG